MEDDEFEEIYVEGVSPFTPEDTCPCGSGQKYDDCCGLYD